MHHPWRAFKALSHYTLHWAYLPDGILGFTDYTRCAVVLTKDMTQAERRCTIAHEVEHIERGPAHPSHRAWDEREVDKAVARKLIGIRDLGEALAWTSCEHQIADELWVDVATLRARLAHLHPSERHYLRGRLEHQGDA